MKKRKLPTIILFIVLISIAISFILFISLIIKSSKLKPEEYTIFDNLEQLNVLDEYIIKTNITDKYLKGISPSEIYSNLILWNDHEYEVYAYTFDSTDSSREYFYEVTGSQTKMNWNFSMVNDIAKSQYVAYYQGCVICIFASDPWTFPDFMVWLNSHFSTVLFEQDPYDGVSFIDQ